MVANWVHKYTYIYKYAISKSFNKSISLTDEPLLKKNAQLYMLACLIYSNIFKIKAKILDMSFYDVISYFLLFCSFLS